MKPDPLPAASLSFTLQRVWPRAAALLLLAAAPAASASGDKGEKPAQPAPPPAAGQTAAPVVETPGSQLTHFGRQIPAQRPNRGIWIPSFSQGALKSVIEADVVTRIDDQRLFAENMTIQLNASEAKDRVTVDTPAATYHMTSQMLRSKERSKVSRADFDLEGDTLVFDTTTSQGRMTGNVRMTIHNARSFVKGNAAAPAQPDDSEAATSKTAAPANGSTEPAPAQPPAKTQP